MIRALYHSDSTKKLTRQNKISQIIDLHISKCHSLLLILLKDIFFWHYKKTTKSHLVLMHIYRIKTTQNLYYHGIKITKLFNSRLTVLICKQRQCYPPHQTI